MRKGNGIEHKEVIDLCNTVEGMKAKLQYYPSYRQIGIKLKESHQTIYCKIQKAIVQGIASEEMANNYRKAAKAK